MDLQYIPLSDTDLKRYIKPKQIYLFEDLKDKKIEEVLPNRFKDSIIILYETVEDNNGHWVALSRYTKNKVQTLEFFDSYRMTPKELYEVNSSRKNGDLDQNENYLSIMIKKFLDKNKKCKFVYNKRKYQSNNPRIATCGRWVVLRISSLLKNDYDLKQFSYLFDEISERYPNKTNDEIISLVVRR